MSRANPATCRTIEVEAGAFPPPATKLVITQHLEVSQDPPFWAWIIVGAFFDDEDNVLWSTEVFAGHLDIQLESDDESTSGDSSISESGTGQGYTDSESETSSSSELFESELYEWYYQRSEIHRNITHHATNSTTVPLAWDPTRQGPVPGYWQASFNPAFQRWVHTWQPYY
ncbi:hypothetical protein AK830_g6272 [Neonectria ditissima]|uniref:Uncharacterized protein n=1 Tax=Neonectria ditissima TaxID=78410 RepID=A0A0P7BCR7_9HYPO|nr:hypothetical protein AK830_g6272 [Neonectria ditissima]